MDDPGSAAMSQTDSGWMGEMIPDRTNHVEVDRAFGFRRALYSDPFGAFNHLCMVLERSQRKFLDMLRIKLEAHGVDDVSPAQAVTLCHISDGSTVRRLIERGHYVGTNASYNLKQLSEAGYIERAINPRDKRAASIRLTTKGKDLVRIMRDIIRESAEVVLLKPEDLLDMEAAIRFASRLEASWTEMLRDGEANAD